MEFFNNTKNPHMQNPKGVLNDPEQRAPKFDPQTGRPLQPEAQRAPRFDPRTGEPLQKPEKSQYRPQYDPHTGERIDPSLQKTPKFDPQTGKRIETASLSGQEKTIRAAKFDPRTGKPLEQEIKHTPKFDPKTGKPLSFQNGQPSQMTDDEPPKKNNTFLILMIILSAIMLIAIGVVLFFLIRGCSGKKDDKTESKPTAAPTEQNSGDIPTQEGEAGETFEPQETHLPFETPTSERKPFKDSILDTAWKMKTLEKDGQSYDCEELGMQGILVFHSDSTVDQFTNGTKEVYHYIVNDNMVTMINGEETINGVYDPATDMLTFSAYDTVIHICRYTGPLPTENEPTPTHQWEAPVTEAPDSESPVTPTPTTATEVPIVTTPPATTHPPIVITTPTTPPPTTPTTTTPPPIVITTPTTPPPTTPPPTTVPPTTVPPTTPPPTTPPPTSVSDSITVGGVTIRRGTTSINGHDIGLEGSYDEVVDISREEIEMLVALCPDLRTLSLDYCCLEDCTPLSKLTKLEKLELMSCGNNSNNGVPLDDIDWIAPLVNLKYLNLCHNAIDDVSALAGLTKLEWLNLGDNLLDDDDLEVIGTLVTLRELYLYKENGISDVSPLADLEKLEVLNVANNKGLKSVQSLTGMKKLKDLRLYSTGIDDLSYFKDFKKLEVVDLANCKKLVYNDYYNNLPKCPKLKKFKVGKDDTEAIWAGEAITAAGYSLEYEIKK